MYIRLNTCFLYTCVLRSSDVLDFLYTMHGYIILFSLFTSPAYFHSGPS